MQDVRLTSTSIIVSFLPGVLCFEFDIKMVLKSLLLLDRHNQNAEVPCNIIAYLPVIVSIV